MDRLSATVAVIVLALFASLAAHKADAGYPTVPNKYTGKLDYVNDLTPVYTAISSARVSGGTRGYDGMDGHTLTCAVVGVQSILFDASGLNPTPTLTAFVAYLYRDGVSVTPQTYYWSVPTCKTLLTGSGSGSTFTPAVFGIWSSSKMDNRVMTLLNYSGATCKAVAPIAVSRIGAQGIQGVPGTSPTVTKPAVISTFNSTPGGGPFVMQPTVGEGDSVSQISILDASPGNTRWFITGDGTAYWKTASGLVITKIDSDGQVTSYDSTGVRTFSNMSSGVGIRKGFDASGQLRYREVRNGAYRMYGPTGAVVQERYSSGALAI